MFFSIQILENLRMYYVIRSNQTWAEETKKQKLSVTVGNNLFECHMEEILQDNSAGIYHMQCMNLLFDNRYIYMCVCFSFFVS